MAIERKIQATAGGATYIVSLPKEWVQRQGLSKNDPVYLSVQDDSTILISIKDTDRSEPVIKDIEISDAMDATGFLKEIGEIYREGYSAIRIKATGERLPAFVRTAIQEYLQKTIGQEILEETRDSIMITDLIVQADMPFEKTAKRMSDIVSRIRDDLQDAMERDDRDLMADVLGRFGDLEKVIGLLIRQANMARGLRKVRTDKFKP